MYTNTRHRKDTYIQCTRRKTITIQNISIQTEPQLPSNNIVESDQVKLTNIYLLIILAQLIIFFIQLATLLSIESEIKYTKNKRIKRITTPKRQNYIQTPYIGYSNKE